ncbi:hypothetical protein OBBRIDRAFT_887461 [Obba rivulosa]|uniref:Uncharacterized protein n=1 Tax=Obba rivulosa TaxID=1052685 RepID=A0A8E2ATP1_9APHY|nr:hypothetical protein OBBRIDRAFT_887461 [Obba rivulosa]
MRSSLHISQSVLGEGQQIARAYEERRNVGRMKLYADTLSMVMKAQPQMSPNEAVSYIEARWSDPAFLESCNQAFIESGLTDDRLFATDVIFLFFPDKIYGVEQWVEDLEGRIPLLRRAMNKYTIHDWPTHARDILMSAPYKCSDKMIAALWYMCKEYLKV